MHIQRIIQILPPAVVKRYKPLGGTNLCLCREKIEKDEDQIIGSVEFEPHRIWPLGEISCVVYKCSTHAKCEIIYGVGKGFPQKLKL